MSDSQRFTDLFPPSEFVGMDPPRNRQMVSRRPQVLTDRDDVHADSREIGQTSVDFFDCLSHAEHQAGLGAQS